MAIIFKTIMKEKQTICIYLNAPLQNISCILRETILKIFELNDLKFLFVSKSVDAVKESSE